MSPSSYCYLCLEGPDWLEIAMLLMTTKPSGCLLQEPAEMGIMRLSMQIQDTHDLRC